MFSKSLSLFALALAVPVLAGANTVDGPVQALKIETVISNMTNQSEALVIKPSFDWQYKAAVIQYAPTGSVLPSWWTGLRPDWCYTSLTWFTAYEAAGNAAVNSRVQVRNLRMYVLSNKTRKWTSWDLTAAPFTDLWKYPFAYAGNNKATGSRTEATGGLSFKPVYPNFMHGYGTSKNIDAPADIRAVYVAMDFRLVVDDAKKPDDREKAKYVVNAGADYYPGKGRSWGTGYAPGIGGSKFLLATKEWRTAAMLVPNKTLGATDKEMVTNPPPLQLAAATK